MIRAFAIAIGVALVLGAPLAFAKPRVAVVAFEDDNSDELTDVVAELLEDSFSVIGATKTGRMIDKLGYDTDLSTKQLKKLANELEVDAIVRGDVAKKNGRKLLHLRLFKNGKKIRGFKVEFVSSRSRKFKDALRDKLAERLGGSAKKAKPIDEEDVELLRKKKDDGDDERDKPRKKKDDGDDDGDKPRKKRRDRDDDTARDDDEDEPRRKKVSRRDEEDDDEPIDGEVEERVLVSTPHTINRAAVRVDFGPSLSQRKLSFTSRAFEEAPRPYSNSPVPGGRVEADIYPFAFGNPNSVIAGLGFGGSFDQTLSLNLQSTVQPGTKFPVKQNHWSVGGRFRFVFGAKPTSPTVTLKGGYATRTFTVDRSKLMDGNVIDLPDVGYKGFTGGLDLRVPVGGPVALFAGGGGIFVTTTGAIQSSSQYGQAKVTGAEGNLGLDVAIGRRMAVELKAEFCQMGFAFTGNGQMANNRDGDPTTKDVGGAADRYLGATVLFGVLY